MADKFTWCARNSSQAQSTASVRRAQFGDGYAQSSANGINSVRRTWTLEFVYKESDMALIIAFLNSHVGKSFEWDEPFFGTSLFYCDEYDYSDQGAGVYSLSATFEQTFQP